MKLFFKNFVTLGTIAFSLIFCLVIIQYPIEFDTHLSFFTTITFLGLFFCYNYKLLISFAKQSKQIWAWGFLFSFLLYIILPFSQSIFAHFAKLHIYEFLAPISIFFIVICGTLTAYFYFPFDELKIKTNDIFFGGKIKNYIYILLITLFCFFGLYARLYRLDFLDPSTDEYYHLIAAKQLAEGKGLQEVYQRGLFIVTIPITLAFKFFGHSVFVARVVGVIINMLAVIPLHCIGKKINKTFSLILIALYTLNPWTIALSRNIREYAYYPVIFYSVFLLCLFLIKNVRNSESLRKAISLKSAIASLLLIFLAYFSLFVDNLSTLKTIGLFYAVSLGFVVTSLFYKSKKYMYYLLPLFVIAVVLVIFYLNRGNFTSLSFIVNDNWLQLFFGQMGYQWFYEKTTFLALFLVIPPLTLMFSIKTPLELKLSSISFLTYLYLFTFHFEKFRTRYAFSAQIFYILFVGVGIYLTYVLAKKSFSKIYRAYILTLLLILFIDPLKALVPSFSQNTTIAAVSEYYHDEMQKTFDFVNLNSRESDILISSLYHKYHSFYEGIHFKEVYEYSYLDESRFEKVEAIITENDHGFMVIDNRRNNHWTEGFPEQDFFIKEKKLFYLKIDQNHIYFW